MISMFKWWVHIRTDGGGYVQVFIVAPNEYSAIQQARAQYGNRLLSESANYAGSA